MSRRMHVEELGHYTASDVESFHSAHEVILSKPGDDRSYKDEQRRERSDLKRRRIDKRDPMEPNPRPHPPKLDRSKVVVPRRYSSLTTDRSCRRTDLVALHKKSCTLFSSIDGTLLHSHLTPPLSEHQPSSVTSTRSSSSFVEAKSPPTTKSTTSLLEPLTEALESKPCRPPLPTVMSWTSDSSRRAEYQKIDRAHGGLRGIWKRMMPKFCRGEHGRRGFFEGACDGHSVRRFRLDLPEACSEKHPPRRWGCLRPS